MKSKAALMASAARPSIKSAPRTATYRATYDVRRAARARAMEGGMTLDKWTLRIGCAVLLVCAALTARPDGAQAQYGAVAVADTGGGYCTGESFNWKTPAGADQGALQSCEQAADYCTDCVVRVRFGRAQCRSRTVRNGD